MENIIEHRNYSSDSFIRGIQVSKTLHDFIRREILDEVLSNDDRSQRSEYRFLFNTVLSHFFEDVDEPHVVLSFDFIRQMCDFIKEVKPSLLSQLQEIVQKSTVLVNDELRKAKREELEKITFSEKLKLNAANLEYSSMVKNVDCTKAKSNFTNLGSELKEVNRQLFMVVNLLLTLVGGFFFGYYVLPYGFNIEKTSLQVLCGMLVAMVVFLVDLYFFIKYLDHIDKNCYKESDNWTQHNGHGSSAMKGGLRNLFEKKNM